MAQLVDLGDLLRHEIQDLYSAEEQIIEALPKMIEKANNSKLKKALSDHLKVTETHKKRLDELKNLISKGQKKDFDDNKGFFSKLFGGSGGEKCKGTEGLIKEGEKMMGEDMTPAVMDSAIIGAAQKIEHYEISGYGTALAYARELGLTEVAGLLKQTLDEEYRADDSLTKLAVGKVNVDAENATPISSNGERSNNILPLKNDRAKVNNSSKSSPSKQSSKRKGLDNSKGKQTKTNLQTSASSGNKKASKSVSSVGGNSVGGRLTQAKRKSGKRVSTKGG